jgi:hypothetical protein
MPSKKISELPALTTPTDNDVFVIVDDAVPATKKLSWANIKTTLKNYFDSLYITVAAAGTVLQEVTATDAGNSTTSTSLVNLNVNNVSITPKSTNSILLIDVQFQAKEEVLSATNTTAYFQLYETGPASVIGAELEHTASAENQGVILRAAANLRARLTNSALTTRTFQLRGRTSHASAAAAATNMVWSIREIKA